MPFYLNATSTFDESGRLTLRILGGSGQLDCQNLSGADR
jgi:hypothetical protein